MGITSVVGGAWGERDDQSKTELRGIAVLGDCPHSGRERSLSTSAPRKLSLTLESCFSFCWYFYLGQQASPNIEVFKKCILLHRQFLFLQHCSHPHPPVNFFPFWYSAQMSSQPNTVVPHHISSVLSDTSCVSVLAGVVTVNVYYAASSGMALSD